MVALSSTESGYMVLSDSSKEANHLRRIFEEISNKKQSTITLNVDNQGSKKLAENPVYHSRTKHIDVRYYFVREPLSTEEIYLKYLATENIPADVFTEGLPRIKHFKCLNNIGIKM